MEPYMIYESGVEKLIPCQNHKLDVSTDILAKVWVKDIFSFPRYRRGHFQKKKCEKKYRKICRFCVS